MALRMKRRRDRRRNRQPPLTPARPKGRAGSGALSVEFLDETIREWQPYSQRQLTREDAREIIYNVTGFMGVLLRWEQAARQNNERTGEHISSDKETIGAREEFD
jgi:hypothetical protein